MIATPPPAEPQYVTVAAIFFSPEEGKGRLLSRVESHLLSLKNGRESYPSAVAHLINRHREYAQHRSYNRILPMDSQTVSF